MKSKIKSFDKTKKNVLKKNHENGKPGTETKLNYYYNSTHCSYYSQGQIYPTITTK